LASFKQQLGTQFEGTVLHYLHHYVELLSESSAGELANFCKSVFQFWHLHRLAVSILEKFVQEFQHVLALPFFLSLVDSDKPTVFGNGFLTTILGESMKFVDSSNSAHIGDQYSMFLPRITETALSNHLVSGKVCQDVIHLSEDQFFGLLKQSSQDSLANDCVTVSNGDDVLVFSCGHHVTKDVLHSSLLPELEKKLTEGDPPLTQTSSLVIDQYRAGGRFNLACPHCVYLGLKQALQVNHS